MPTPRRATPSSSSPPGPLCFSVRRLPASPSLSIYSLIQSPLAPPRLEGSCGRKIVFFLLPGVVRWWRNASAPPARCRGEAAPWRGIGGGFNVRRFMCSSLLKDLRAFPLRKRCSLYRLSALLLMPMACAPLLCKQNWAAMVRGAGDLFSAGEVLEMLCQA